MSLFAYMGNKTSLVKHYLSPPKGTKRIVEPFAGSMGYAFSYDYDKLGIETNKEIVDMYKWLMKADLTKTLEKVEKYTQNFDLRETTEFCPEEKTYISLNCVLMTGAIGKNVIHIVDKPIRPAIENAVAILRLMRERNIQLEIKHGSAFELYTSKDVRDGDLVFIDPPYESSNELYIMENSQIEQIVEYIKSLSEKGVPIIFTYGTDAKEVFPHFDWKAVSTKVCSPIMNKKKAHLRTEHVCYINMKSKFEYSLFDE